MSFYASEVTLHVPQLGVFHWSDFASALASLMAFGALVVAIVQVKQAKKSNARIYLLATSQLEQSKTDGQRQYDSALLQMKRENRIRVYAPLLGFLRASMMEFQTKSSSIIFKNNSGARSDHEINLENLKKSTSTYEFWAEFELLGDPTVSVAVSKWIRALDDAYDLLGDLKALQEGLAFVDDNERDSHMQEIAFKRNELKQVRISLVKDLDSLKDVILNEFQSKQ